VLNPINLLELFKKAEDPAGYVPESDEYLEKILRETKRRIWWRRLRQLLTLAAIIALVAITLVQAYEYTQTRYYIGELDGKVTIYQGIKESFGSIKFSHPMQQTQILVSDLNSYQQQLIERTISAESFDDAKRVIKLLSPGVK
jgi:protein phosphatase